MSMINPNTRSRVWPFYLISRLRMLIRTHENSSVRLVITSLIILLVLDFFNRATFQSVEIEYKLLEVWSESPLWIIIGAVNLVWLLIFQKPPKVIWGLWASTALFAAWGGINLSVGIVASHPVSLLGPFLMLLVIAPLAWTTADAMQERVTSDQATKGQIDVAARHRSEG